MGYVENNLMSGESVVYRAHLHWSRYLGGAAWLLLGLLSLPGSRPLGVILLLVAGVTLGFAFLDIKTSEFAVTNKRVFLKQGIFRRKAVELLIGRIESLNVEQGVVGRMLGFGAIVPGGTGGTKQGFHKIAAPLEFRKHVTTQIEASTQGRAATP
jgi:uncharacterized membrane protein YdbT with pleckstrin-like domain